MPRILTSETNIKDPFNKHPGNWLTKHGKQTSVDDRFQYRDNLAKEKYNLVVLMQTSEDINSRQAFWIENYEELKYIKKEQHYGNKLWFWVSYKYQRLFHNYYYYGQYNDLRLVSELRDSGYVY